MQHCVDQGHSVHSPACCSLQSRQGCTRQNAAGACIEQRGAEMAPFQPTYSPFLLIQWEGRAGEEVGLNSPRPEPWGSSDQVCSSKPPPKTCNSWSLSESEARGFTIPAHTKVAFSRAPVGEQRWSLGFQGQKQMCQLLPCFPALPCVVSECSTNDHELGHRRNPGSPYPRPGYPLHPHLQGGSGSV